MDCLRVLFLLFWLVQSSVETFDNKEIKCLLKLQLPQRVLFKELCQKNNSMSCKKNEW